MRSPMRVVGIAANEREKREATDRAEIEEALGSDKMVHAGWSRGASVYLSNKARGSLAGCAFRKSESPGLPYGLSRSRPA